MRERRWLLATGVALALAACSDSAPPGEAPIFAGAELDSVATDAANAMALSAGQGNKVSRIYFTSESYEAVAGFYGAKGKEAPLPVLPEELRILPDGGEVRRSAFILDGAADLAQSDLWANVQRPFFTGVDTSSGTPVYQGLRDVTTIVIVERR
jgi:hypothetical protein